MSQNTNIMADGHENVYNNHKVVKKDGVNTIVYRDHVNKTIPLYRSTASFSKMVNKLNKLHAVIKEIEEPHGKKHYTVYSMDASKMIDDVDYSDELLVDYLRKNRYPI